MNNTVLEYLEGYFGDQLNESTSDEDIMEAFYDLLETADAVEEFLESYKRAERMGRVAGAADYRETMHRSNISRGGKGLLSPEKLKKDLERIRRAKGTQAVLRRLSPSKADEFDTGVLAGWDHQVAKIKDTGKPQGKFK